MNTIGLVRMPQTKPQSVQFGSNSSPKVTMNDVKAFKNQIAQLLLGQKPGNPMALYQSRFNINGVGITKVGENYALSIMTESQSGRNEVLKALAKMKGYHAQVPGLPIGRMGSGDAVVGLEFKNKTIPIVVRYTGPIVAH